MKIFSWNIAGIRASIKRNDLAFLEEGEYDIVCFQETKAEEGQVKLSSALCETYPFRFWQSTQGITQRKGFSGTCIWCKTAPVKQVDPPSIDLEGRVTALEFESFILINVYTPNSQKVDSERNVFRLTVWDVAFMEYIHSFEKPVIICGDLNVANEPIDLYKSAKVKKPIVGYLDKEREHFKDYLASGFVDAFRIFNQESGQYTYWDQRFPQLRQENRGWRIDYFLVEGVLQASHIKSCEIKREIMGSDHCPITIQIES